jgi:hypothetical protein
VGFWFLYSLPALGEYCAILLDVRLQRNLHATSHPISHEHPSAGCVSRVGHCNRSYVLSCLCGRVTQLLCCSLVPSPMFTSAPHGEVGFVQQSLSVVQKATVSRDLHFPQLSRSLGSSGAVAATTRDLDYNSQSAACQAWIDSVLPDGNLLAMVSVMYAPARAWPVWNCDELRSETRA